MPEPTTAGLRRFLLLWFVVGACALGSSHEPLAAADQPPAPSDRSLLKIVGVDVQPANPGPDTLCKFRVRLRNSGNESASDLSFQVRINEQRLANYVNHSFRSTLEPGKDTDVPLFNFWSSEAGRPYPADGRLVIEVRLLGAQWVDAKATPATLAGPVQPLPLPFSVTLVRNGR